ncbi:IS30 family transposase, partial [Corynebacterium glutamicum]
SGLLATEHANDSSMQISHETIYQALYVQGKGALRDELKVEKFLRTGRKGRKPQSKLPSRGKPWVEGALISQRPAEVADRAVPGHWEGD